MFLGRNMHFVHFSSSYSGISTLPDHILGIFDPYRRNGDALTVLGFQARYTRWLPLIGLTCMFLSCVFSLYGLGHGLLYLKGGEIDFFHF